MRTETAKRCVVEINRFLEAWENVQVKHVNAAAGYENPIYSTATVKRINEDWLDRDGFIGRERAALRRASLDLSQALADLRQGR